jgi:hypothetical protein
MARQSPPPLFDHSNNRLDFRFSRRRVSRWLSSGMLRRVVW